MMHRVTSTLSIMLLSIVSMMQVAVAEPSVKARAWLLMDIDSGQVLAEHNADEQRAIGSLTKLMLALETLEKFGRNEPVTSTEVEARPVKTTGSRIHLAASGHISISELLDAIIIASANDAAILLAEHLAGSEAAMTGLMNARAQQLGLSNTRFTNVTGLDQPGHHSSARDLARLASRLIADHPGELTRFSQKIFSYRGLEFHNRNALLWQMADITGMKTGQTRHAAHCLAASAERDGMRLVAVVLGADNAQHQADAARELLEYGFTGFETRRLYQANHGITNVPVWMGERDKVAAGVSSDIVLTLARGRHHETRANLEFDHAVYAPVRRGQPLGTLKISLGDRQLVEAPLVALAPIDEGGLFSRLMDSIRIRFQ
ncbi:MAG: D-alanyl-D-alanine carboxypeptidase [Gammaproteobacteria bacterium]|nr:D-alanyl-D-alanine carboxypeptidase [Gammaproteobacteria bacterium]